MDLQLRVLRKPNTSVGGDRLQYLGVGKPILISTFSDAPPDSLIGTTDKGLAYWCTEWKDVPIVLDIPSNNRGDNE